MTGPSELDVAKAAATRLRESVQALPAKAPKKLKAKPARRREGWGSALMLAFDALESDQPEVLARVEREGLSWSSEAFGEGGALGAALSRAPKCAAWLLRERPRAVEAFGDPSRRLNPESHAASPDCAAGLGWALERGDEESAQAIWAFLKPHVGAREGLARRPNALGEALIEEAFARDDAGMLAWMLGGSAELTLACLRGARGGLVGGASLIGRRSLAPWASGLGSAGEELAGAVRALSFGAQGSSLAVWALAEGAQRCAAALLQTPPFQEAFNSNREAWERWAILLAKTPEAVSALESAGVDLDKRAFGFSWAQLRMLDSPPPKALLEWAAKHRPRLIEGPPCPFEELKALVEKAGAGPRPGQIDLWKARAQKAALASESKTAVRAKAPRL